MLNGLLSAVPIVWRQSMEFLAAHSRRHAMITFNVVKEQHGWAIRMAERMMTPFWSRDLAIREANCLARAIRCHGECAEVIVEDAVPSEPLTKSADTRSAAA
jgi:hypothetical protein